MVYQSKLALFSVLPERIEHIHQQISCILVSEWNSSHIGLQQMSVVEHMVLPSFQVFVQHSLSFPFVISKGPSHLIENLRQKHFFCVFDLQYPDSANALDSQTVVPPGVHSLSQIWIISLFHQFLKLGHRILLKTLFMLPNVKCSLELMFAPTRYHVPYSLNTRRSKMIWIHLINLELLPSVKYFRNYFIVFNLDWNIAVLLSGLKRA